MISSALKMVRDFRGAGIQNSVQSIRLLHTVRASTHAQKTVIRAC